MRGLGWRGVLMTVVAAVAAQAAEFKLSVQPMTLEEARSGVGGYGGFGQFSLVKPVGLKKIPKLATNHPLYGQLLDPSDGSGAPMVFVLDEPKGSGKGYERLYADLDRNGDLTDDGKWDRLSAGAQRMPPDYEQGNFGPIDLPADKAVGIWRPSFFVEVYLYNIRMIRDGKVQAGQDGSIFPVGQLRLMPANYLGTTVELEGVRQRIGLVDGNCNFKLGDPAQSTMIQRSANATTWYLMPRDYLLRDRDGSGKFERRMNGSDAEPFSQFVYFGVKPHRLTLTRDLASIVLNPEPGPYGELVLQAEVDELLLGWAAADSEVYHALTPWIDGGRVLIPAGKVRVATCAIKGIHADGSWIRTESRECPDTVLRVGPDAPVSLALGKPLQLKVTAELRHATLGAEARAAAGDQQGDKTLLINVAIQGAWGEAYSGFLQGSTANAQVPPPTFEVLGPDGQQVTTGKLEYG